MKLAELLEEMGSNRKDSIFRIAKDHGINPDSVDIARKGRTNDADKMKLNDGERSVLQYMTTRHVDKDFEIVVPAGVMFDEFQANPVKVWGHDYRLPPIGHDPAIKRTQWGVQAKTVYDDNPDNKLASIAFGLRKKGMLKTSSIGFLPLERYIRKRDGQFDQVLKKLAAKWPELKGKVLQSVNIITTKSLLLEDSDVTIPANVNAQTLAVAKGELGADPELLDLLGFGDFRNELDDVFKDFNPDFKGLEGQGEDDETERIVEKDWEPIIEVDQPRFVEVETDPNAVAKECLDEHLGKV